MFDENSIISTIDELSLLTNETVKILKNIEILSNEINYGFNNIFDNYFINIKNDMNKTHDKLRNYAITLNNIINKDLDNG